MPIVTLDSIKNKQGGTTHDSEDDEDGGGNEYYTGGTNNQGGGSGLAVVAPSGDKDKPKDPLARALERAKKQSKQEPGQAPSGRTARITIYANGFVVDDGPFRRLGEPANDHFAESLAQGFCPQELVKDGKPADVHLTNKSHEQYPGDAGGKATPQPVAFEGEGRSTGSSAAAGFVVVVGMEGAGMFSLDEPKASVRVQVRFPDGTREVLKFEKHHTVRHFIHRIESMRQLSRYQILVADRGNPKPLLLQLFDQTLTEAGLAGSVVTIDAQVG